MAHYLAHSDYEDKDSHPLCLKTGDRVRVGRPDQTWPGWIWAIDRHGHDGYVPEEILAPAEEGLRRVTADFDPTVLTVRRGDRLESLRRIHGWHWCRHEAGREGWVAGYILRPVD
jgi:hypothetical protein